MKRINKYISLLLATALLASCDKFDEINTDPDATLHCWQPDYCWTLPLPVPVNPLYTTNCLPSRWHGVKVWKITSIMSSGVPVLAGILP